MGVPPTRSGALLRARLHATLRENTGARLTTVVAPAGWGKTTLLAAWARDPAESRQVVWVSLDEADNEPVRFWTYALTALAAVAPACTRQALAALEGQGLDPVSVAVPALLNALVDLPDRYVLVLDDYHVISDARIHDSVELLLGYLPAALQLVLAARAEPPLPLARLRARGQLTELHLADLRCTPGEGAALLASSGMTDAQLANELVTRTEGWPAGLHLAALVLRDSERPTSAVRGDTRPILEFFTAEVMPALDTPARELLVGCSVLEHLCGPLCDAVLGTVGSAGVLDALDRAEVFVTALDPARHWYRCHQLFRDVLRRQLDHSDPDAAPVLLGAAADWYLAGGQIDDAVRARLAAGDHAGAWALLDGRWFLDHGAMAELLHLGEQLADRCATHPQLCLWLAHAAALCGQGAGVRRWLEAAEPLITGDAAPPPGWHSLRAFADVIWAAYGATADTPASLNYARRAVALENDPTGWGWAHARMILGAAERGAGALEAAVPILEDAWHTPGRRQMPTLLTLQYAGELMLQLVELGEHNRARRVDAEIADTALATERAWGPGAAAALARIRLAEARITLAEHGPHAALPALAQAVALAEAWDAPNIVVLALTSHATALWNAGHHAQARATLTKAREHVETHPPRPYAEHQLAELETHLGRRATAEARTRGALVEELTDRELAVLRALRGPLSAREIGAELHLSINTIKTHTKSIYRKLGVATRTEAVTRAHQLDLI